VSRKLAARFGEGQMKRDRKLLVIPRGVEVSPTGLKITAKLSYREWEKLGVTLQAIHRSILWWAGDWLLWGEKTFSEEFSQAIAEYSKQTLCNAMWVSKQIEPSRRLENLSWSHHQEVASLDKGKQDRFLREAVENKWGVHELRQQIRLFRSPEPKIDWQKPADPPEVHVNSEEYEEVGEQILSPTSTERPSIESDFRHLLDLCRALRSAEKRRDEGDAIRLRTALDVFIAGHDGA
jgi:hypothetical protein